MSPEDTQPAEVQVPAAPEPSARKKGRWSWLILILAVSAAAFAGLGYFEQLDAARSLLRYFVIIPLAGLLSIAWWCFFSGLTVRTRLTGLGIFAVLGASAAACIRDVKFAGDMRPIFTWIWDPDPEELARRAKAEQPQPGGETSEPAKLEITADDWPQFRNDDREGRDPTVQLARDFDAHPPEEVWRINVGLGWSSFAIVDDLCWTQEQVFDDELVVCYELKTGKR
ncbi:MAG: hypothetical protein JJ992_15150, partial [Planctomycetes bacterium]|nr:hypothetical protein [Planctomycetota bacterium]